LTRWEKEYTWGRVKGVNNPPWGTNLQSKYFGSAGWWNVEPRGNGQDLGVKKGTRPKPQKSHGGTRKGMREGGGK